MSGKPGERLTDDEVKEYAAYHNAQITPPEKFDKVVVENVSASGPVYRWASEAEVKSADAAAESAARSVRDNAKLDEQIRAEASKRVVDVPVPAAPPAAPPKS